MLLSKAVQTECFKKLLWDAIQSVKSKEFLDEVRTSEVLEQLLDETIQSGCFKMLLSRAKQLQVLKTVLSKAIKSLNLKALCNAERELRSIMCRMAVDECDPQVKAILFEAEGLNHLPVIDDQKQRDLHRSWYESWLNCFVEYLNTLRRESESAVVLPLFLVSRIFMRLPHCKYPFPHEH